MKKCDYCDQEKEDVYYRNNPYQYEINDNEDDILLCDDCYNNLLGDI